ncbi:MAG TPA: nuclear transport factor 2 family protein [Streptosporangiaceae bacterium]
MEYDNVLDTEKAFFEGLLNSDVAALDAVLAPDFQLIGVLDGQVVPREALLAVIGSGQLEFLQIDRDPADVSVRGRAGLAVVVGRTRMTMRFQGAEASVGSRYTHVYVEDGGWRLLSAQGTRENNQG